MKHESTMYTLAEVSVWDNDLLPDLSQSALLYTPDEAKATASAWAWLLDILLSSAIFEDEKETVLSDAELFVRINQPVIEFLDWWRRDEWEHFGRDDEVNPGEFAELWAWRIMDKLRELAIWLGPRMARQVSVVEAVRQFESGSKSAP